MNKCVVYVMSGPAHLPYLVTSLHTLRDYYDGPVRVYAWPESYEIANRVCGDFYGVECMAREPTYRGKNAQFFDKLHVMQEAPGDVNLYLDADTLIEGSLDPLFEMGSKGFVATQFCDWTTAGVVIQNRIKRLIGRDVPQAAVKQLLEGPPQPSVNGGVWACKPNSLALEQWQRWTSKVLDIFIADETVLHLVIEAYRISLLSPCQIETSGRYNYSPKMYYKHKEHPSSFIKDDDIVVWHGHGDCFTRPNKSLEGTQMWMSAYYDCLEDNVGGIADWRGDIRHKYLDRLEDWLSDKDSDTAKRWGSSIAGYACYLIAQADEKKRLQEAAK